jgi:hypothetical protein
MGEQACAAALKSCKAPWAGLLEGPFEFGGGAQRAVMIARMAQRYSLHVADCETAEELRALGINAHEGPAEDLVQGAVLRIDQPFSRLPQHP